MKDVGLRDVPVGHANRQTTFLPCQLAAQCDDRCAYRDAIQELCVFPDSVGLKLMQNLNGLDNMLIGSIALDVNVCCIAANRLFELVEKAQLLTLGKPDFQPFFSIGAHHQVECDRSMEMEWFKQSVHTRLNSLKLTDVLVKYQGMIDASDLNSKKSLGHCNPPCISDI